MKATLPFLTAAILLASCTDETLPTLPTATADFVAPPSGEHAIAVSFQNQSSNATHYVWSFGDGEVGYDEHPTHTYKAPGTYAVKLKAFSTDRVDSVSKSIVVNPYSIFSHVDLAFAGTYACKVVSTELQAGQPVAKQRLPDMVISLTKEASNTLLWNNVKFVYDPATPSAPQLPHTLGWYGFDGPTTVKWPVRTDSFIYIHAVGDSATFVVNERTGTKGNGTTTTYYGTRRR